MRVSRRLRFAVLLTLYPVAHPVLAVGTPANTSISNSATATFTDAGGNPQSVNSNTTTVAVDEILNVTVANNDGGNVTVTTPDTNAPQSYTVTNTGNGSESYNLTFNNALGGDQFNPTNTRLFADTNGNGSFDPATDTQITSVTLAPDIGTLVFVVSDIPASLANGDLGRQSMTATAATGSGAAGTTFAGQGTGGVDAVVGATTATVTAQNDYLVSQVTTTLTKNQAVLDPFGGGNAVPGAIITYTLTFTVSGAGSISNAQIVDPIPANTTYKPNSLALNGGPLTDVVDGDAGRFSGGQIVVIPGAAGTVNAPATHTVTFQVTIN